MVSSMKLPLSWLTLLAVVVVLSFAGASRASGVSEDTCEAVTECRPSISCESYESHRRACSGIEVDLIIGLDRYGTPECKIICTHERAYRLERCLITAPSRYFLQRRLVRRECEDYEACHKRGPCLTRPSPPEAVEAPPTHVEVPPTPMVFPPTPMVVPPTPGNELCADNALAALQAQVAMAQDNLNIAQLALSEREAMCSMEHD